MSATFLDTLINDTPHQPVSELLRARAKRARGTAKRWARALGCSHRTIENRIHRSQQWTVDDAVALARQEAEIRADIIRMIVEANPEARNHAMNILEAMCQE